MNARTVGDTHVHFGLSSMASSALLIGLSFGLLLLQPILLFGLASIEQIITGAERAEYLQKLLAVSVLASSISAMAAPLIACYRAILIGSSNHGLQWHLFAAFGFACALGVVYGLRSNIYAIVVSNFCGLIIQLISLAAVWALSDSAWRYTRYAFDLLPLRSSMRMSAPLAITFHWLIYTLIMSIVFGGIIMIAFTMPLHKMLGPLFTVTCVLPYAATFSTFTSDIVSYRRWERLPPSSSEKMEGPKGVDITTLLVMQVNNILWNFYGMLILDPAVLISSSCSYFAGAIQIIVYMFPVFEFSLRNDIVRLDPAYPFLGAKAFLTKGPANSYQHNEQMPHEVIEKLSAVELMVTTTTEPAGSHHTEPHRDSGFETPAKFPNSEGASINHQVPYSTDPNWTLYTTGKPLKPRSFDIV